MTHHDPAAGAQRPAFRRVSALAGLLLLGAATWFATGTAAAQTLPVTVSTHGNSATIQIGADNAAGMSAIATHASVPGVGRTEVKLDFDHARGLSADTLGVSAEAISPDSPLLRGRLPDAQLTALSALQSMPRSQAATCHATSASRVPATWRREIRRVLVRGVRSWR